MLLREFLGWPSGYLLPPDLGFSERDFLQTTPASGVVSAGEANELYVVVRATAGFAPGASCTILSIQQVPLDVRLIPKDSRGHRGLRWRSKRLHFNLHILDVYIGVLFQLHDEAVKIAPQI